MREGWKEYKIDDVALVGDGAHASIKRQESGIMYLTSKNFDLNGLKLEKVDYISENDFMKYFNQNSKALTKPNYNDVLLSIIGSMGAPYVVKENDLFGLSSSVSILRPKQEIILPKYLYYWIKSEYFQKSIDSIKSGVAQSFLSLGMIKSLPCITPPLQTQRKIASILSSYDDLIENNLKRIKLLEEKAQLTYEEWFVKMRFPGYETAVFDEVTGLPKGWGKTTIGEICKVSGGGTPSRSVDEYWEDGDITWYSPTDLSKANSLCVLDSSQKITELGLKKSSAKLLNENSFMMTSRATIGLFALVNKPFTTNQGFINVTPIKEFEKEYLLYNFKYRIEEFKGHATGATFPELSKSKFNALDIIWPNENSLKQFNKITSILHIQLFNLTNQNRVLKEARDILLPRLMSGMIDVENIVIQNKEPKELQNT